VGTEAVSAARTVTRPAWYASSREWVTLLHPPYTAWHLSYVLVGAGLAPHLDGVTLAGTLLAFGLAVGVGAHAFDELIGRPLATTISSRRLAAAATASLAAAAAIGVAGIGRVGWGLVPLIAAGVVLVLAYNLEWWGGRLHGDAVFAVAWGAFPVVTAYYAQTRTVRPAALAAAVFAYGLSHAQRTLSTEARRLRRRVTSVAGAMTDREGRAVPITRDGLLQPYERALKTLSWTACALGVALILSRSL
jgi:hypothetical protein